MEGEILFGLRRQDREKPSGDSSAARMRARGRGGTTQSVELARRRIVLLADRVRAAAARAAEQVHPVAARAAKQAAAVAGPVAKHARTTTSQLVERVRGLMTWLTERARPAFGQFAEWIRLHMTRVAHRVPPGFGQFTEWVRSQTTRAVDLARGGTGRSVEWVRVVTARMAERARVLSARTAERTRSVTERVIARARALTGWTAVRVSRLTARADARLDVIMAWATRRSITPPTMATVSLLLGICAAGWYSGGPGSDTLWGTIALACWCVALLLARRLAAFSPMKADSPSAWLAAPVGGPSLESAVRRSPARATDSPLAPSAAPRPVPFADPAPVHSAEPAASPASPQLAPSNDPPPGRAAVPASRLMVRFARTTDGSTDWLVFPHVHPPRAAAPAVPDSPPSAPANPPSAPVRPPSAPVNPPSAPVNPPSAPVNPPSGPVRPPSPPDNPPSPTQRPASPADRTSARRNGAASQRKYQWPIATCAVAAESAIYGGLAAGGQSAGVHRIWLLAVMTIVSVGVTEMLCASRRAAAGQVEGGRDDAGGSTDRASGVAAALWRWVDMIVAPAAPARLVVAVIGLAIDGPEGALLAVLAAEVLSACGVIILSALASGTSRFARPAEPRALRAYRDDGPLARWVGRLAKGNLIPLPPVLAGLVATALLAALGLHGLPGFIVLAPPLVMLLAASGSSHRHDGALDWLVPALLVLAQYIYLAAFGFAERIQGPIVFIAVAMTVLWYIGLSVSPGETGSGVGWEMRMLVAGLGAIFGLAPFVYVGLAAYLGALICRKAVIGYLIPREEYIGDRYGARRRGWPQASS